MTRKRFSLSLFLSSDGLEGRGSPVVGEHAIHHGAVTVRLNVVLEATEGGR